LTKVTKKIEGSGGLTLAPGAGKIIQLEQDLGNG
jgi:hypothetical protein